ncbi:MAG: hypothetical protein ACK5HY_00780 [Parahaliea sp.]
MDITVQLELSVAVLHRLLRNRSIAASEFRCLDLASHRAGCEAVKSSCTDCMLIDASSSTPDLP